MLMVPVMKLWLLYRKVAALWWEKLVSTVMPLDTDNGKNVPHNDSEEVGVEHKRAQYQRQYIGCGYFQRMSVDRSQRHWRGVRVVLLVYVAI